VIESKPLEILSQPLDEHGVRLYASANHHQNWLDCIKSRKEPICNVEIGHRSATVCHLGNIAIRTGKRIVWDARKQEIVSGGELVKWCRGRTEQRGECQKVRLDSDSLAYRLRFEG